MEGLTACTECDVTGNEHTDVTTMGFTHAQDSECYSALVTSVRRWEGQWVGPPWVDEWEGHVYILGGNGRDDQTKTEDITHTYIFNKVLLLIKR